MRVPTPRVGAAAPGVGRGVAVGGLHACAALLDGTARCWGRNDNSGQLGDGTAVNRRTPVGVTGVSGIVRASSAGLGTCVLLNDATMRCWGANYYGNVGDGTTTPRAVATPVANLTTGTMCSASPMLPVAETCNGADDDCNGLIDDAPGMICG